MATPSIHMHYIIKCPKAVDPDQVNPESFKDFIPPNATAIGVKGLTLNNDKMPCRWEISLQFPGGLEVDYGDNIKRYNLRQQVDIYKPRNTNLLKEKQHCGTGECYWIFEYQNFLEGKKHTLFIRIFSVLLQVIDGRKSSKNILRIRHSQPLYLISPLATPLWPLGNANQGIFFKRICILN